jgi:hypothetical protein
LTLALTLLGDWKNANEGAFVASFFGVAFFAASCLVAAFVGATFPFLATFGAAPPTPAILNVCDFFGADPFGATFFGADDEDVLGAGVFGEDPNRDKVGDLFCGTGEGEESDEAGDPKMDRVGDSLGVGVGVCGCGIGVELLAALELVVEPNIENVGDFLAGVNDGDDVAFGADFTGLDTLEPEVAKMEDVGDLLGAAGAF